MIYFIQDTSVHHIKIGFTTAPDAEKRLRELQTGCPSGLVLLGTAPGEKADEAALHQQFAAHRVHGEWFKPVPEILAHILDCREDQAVNACRLRCNPTEQKGPSALPWPLSIYLAGKISANCWRHEIVGNLASIQLPSHEDCSEILSWPTLRGCIFGEHHYVGPFYSGCTHGGFHGDDSHGILDTAICCFGDDKRYKSFHGQETHMVVERCLEAVSRADVVFAWIEANDCYGTIVELGYAHALGKALWIDGPRRFRDMWFVHELDDFFWRRYSWGVNPLASLHSRLEYLREERKSCLANGSH